MFFELLLQVESFSGQTNQFVGNFGIWNWLVFFAYLATLAWIGWVYRNQQDQAESYFDGGQSIPWPVAGLSIYATHQSAVTCMGIPALAYSGNWAIFLGYLTIPPAAIIAGYFFAKEFRHAGVQTCYEYLELKFDSTVQKIIALFFVLLQLAKLSVYLYFPAMAISLVSGLDIFLTIVLVGGIVTLYTSIGGIRSVVWSDFLQVGLMTGGALICIVSICYQKGGLGEVIRIASENDKFQILSFENGHLENIVWIIVVGGFITSMYSFSSEQNIVQRYLVTSNTKRTILSCWLNSLFIVPAAALFFFLGTSLWVFYQGNSQQLELKDQLVPFFILDQLPVGLAGLAIAGLMAAAMSSVDSSINSAAAVVWNDLFQNRSQKKVDYYQLTSFVFGILGVTGASLIANFEIQQMFNFFIGILSCFGGVIFSLFLLARISKKPSSIAAKIGLGCGVFTVIICLFVLKISVKNYELAIAGFVGSFLPAISVSWIMAKFKTQHLASRP